MIPENESPLKTGPSQRRDLTFQFINLNFKMYFSLRQDNLQWNSPESGKRHFQERCATSSSQKATFCCFTIKALQPILYNLKPSTPQIHTTPHPQNHAELIFSTSGSSKTKTHPYSLSRLITDSSVHFKNHSCLYFRISYYTVFPTAKVNFIRGF